MFVDRIEIEVQGGRGGDGCVSFRREKFIPRGGPNGGDGGRGGDVILVTGSGVDSLAEVSQKKHWRAGFGAHGAGADKTGRDGEDIVLRVPQGTLVIDSAAGYVIKDLAALDESVIVAKGGAGGKGNTHFKTSTNRAPREATDGGDGELRRVVLELKMIADVGLVGKPNAGKSTLLSRLSRARPEIADYPFTTKFPNLGIVQIDRDRSFVMADIPGLIEGAHAGAGLGHEFLRHVERTGVLVHLVEPLPMDGTDPVANYEHIRDELRQYKPALAERPEAVIVTKGELPGAADVRQRLADKIGRPVLLISAVTGQGLPPLVQSIARLLNKWPQAD